MKSIIYFDENKFFSLSSQVFSGVTEFLIKEKLKGSTEEETQKGPMASGKILADAIISSEKDTERRVMHDYAFSLFETEIFSQGLVQEIASAGNFSIPNLERPFVRISSPANIFDVRRVRETMEKFNSLGEALAYIQSKDLLDEHTASISEQISATKDRQKINSLQKQKDQVISQILANASRGMWQDQKFLDYLSKISQYGFEDSFEIHQSVDDKRFTSCLKRDCLREDESLLVRKYSRTTKMNFVVLGTVTNYPQASTGEEVGSQKNENKDLPGSMKNAFINLMKRQGDFEATFSDVDTQEYMIDPIVVYVTLGSYGASDKA